MELKKLAVISDEFKEFIQSGNYEVSILKLMNQSRIVFPNSYIRNENQSNSECDFVDTLTAEKYEAKLPFDKKEGALICSNKGNLKDWLVYMMDEEAEFGDLSIEKRGQHNVTELKLYKTLAKRLRTVQENENAMFFFPYSITLDMDLYDSFSMLQFCSDILDSVFRELKRNGLVGNRKEYAKALMNNDEIRTISRTEYENLQHQVEQLTAQLDAVNSAENITISNTEYEQLKQQINWLTEQLVTMSKDKYVTKSEGLNKEICEQLGMMPNEVESYHTVGTVKEIQVPLNILVR